MLREAAVSLSGLAVKLNKKAFKDFNVEAAKAQRTNRLVHR